MSAINGVFERRGEMLSSKAFSASLEALSDYGHDGSHEWLSPSVCLGHQLTALLPDEKKEQIPLYDSSARLAITTDARLDNRPELCDALNVPEVERRNLSDSRLILRAWQKWEYDCSRYLIGDYAFAIWDEKRRTLFCARDHIGARPFYYSLTPERFVFASDIKVILVFPGVSDKLDEDYITASLADKRFYLKDRTYFAAIKRLAPGHSLIVQAQSVNLERFWFPENVKKIRFAKDEDYADAAREIYTRAVADRLRETEQVGVHLSGGLDSSSIAILTAQQRRKQGLKPPDVFSWQPPPKDDDSAAVREYAQIKAVCEQESLIVQYCPMKADDVLAVLKKDPTREPVDTTILIENTIQRTAAQRGVRLILSGWGGDESLSYDGRGYHAELLLRGRWWRLFREGRKHGSALKFISREAFLLLFPERTEALKKLKARSLKAGTHSKSFIRPELKSHIKLHNIRRRQTSIRSTIFWLWERGMLAERMEAWAAHGAPLKISYAYPLTDRRLLEFVAALPSEQFVRGRWKRWIMRKTLDGILPPEVCWQPDKHEPIRVEQGLTAVYQALEMARKQIESTSEMPSRASYFDMKRLLECLQPEILAQRPRQADMTRALQFLDF